MKKTFKKIAMGFILFALGFWILSIIPFKNTIDQEIPVNIYRDGVVADTTIVSMVGEKTNYLFNENTYWGTFHIYAVEKTGRDGMAASIKWFDEGNYQRLYYSYRGPFIDATASIMIINDDMTRFALTLLDGTILATSDEVYRIYTEHITYDPDTEVTSIYDTIPFF